MKKISFTAILRAAILLNTLLISVIASAQKNGEPYLVKTFTGTISSVEAVTSGGNIEVAGQAGGESKVEVYIRGNNYNDHLDKEEIRQRLERYDLTVEQQGSKIIAKVKGKNNNNNWKNGLSISFKIYSPVKINTNLRTSGGNILLNNLDGKLDFATSGGNLELQSLRGTLDGRTSGGNIELEDCHNEIDLTTSGGNIDARKSDGNITLNTSGGNLEMNDLDGKISARTSGGNIDAEAIKGSLRTSTSGGSIDLDDMQASVEASTSGGGITARISKLGEYLRLNTNSGSIKIRMPLTAGIDLDIDGDHVNVGTLNNFSGKIEKDRVVGKLNGGGVPVELSASSGSVTVNAN